MRLLFAIVLVTTPALAETTDPYLWLEQVQSPKALAWVQQENERTLKPLLTDPHYQTFLDQSLAITQAKDRIPEPEFLDALVYNIWQDAGHPQGLWRRTSPPDYATAAPHWQTVIDVDALGHAEHHTWVWKGANCQEPAEVRCLVDLSEGGEDAVTAREFDLPTSSFVSAGFAIPHAKQTVDWEDANTLLVGTDWGSGSMTDSGYPFVIKRLRRGEKLSDAVEVFRGAKQDVSVVVSTFVDGQGHQAMMLQRGLDFFRSAFFVVTGKGVTKLALPEKAQVAGLVDNQLVVALNQDLPGTPTLAAGSLVALDMAHPDARPSLIWAPGPRQALDQDQVRVTAGHVLAVVLDNVRGRAMAFAHDGHGWSARTVALPDNAAISIVATTPRSDLAALQVTSFLLPNSMYFADLGALPGAQTITAAPAAGATGDKPVGGAGGIVVNAKPESLQALQGKSDASETGSAVRLVKSLPAKFDASRDTVEQFEATSTDGTKIPYFVVHPKAMAYDGNNPTLLTGYGGFQVSETPVYNPGVGKLWLESGGVYVLANIRGGGEFGPAWHEAGLKTNRQRIYDDFASVARDLIARKITSPRHLGIRGRSNGGLLMGVEFEQHPDLWHAVIIGVPLLDMLRFEKIAAGASWVGEYGSVSNPLERAFLAKISPYQNLREGVHYPEPFIFTTTLDDRVGPQHARKFAAEMQAMGLPFFYHESIEGGHAGQANLREAAENQALEMTYLTMELK